jgi:hypothetical protein
VQAPKEEKAIKEREHPHHANIKKQSKFFVKGNVKFLCGAHMRLAAPLRHIH